MLDYQYGGVYNTHILHILERMKAMTIKVRLFATLRDGRDKEVMVEGTDGMTCQDIIDQLAISEEDVSILLVNGRDAKLDDSLSPEDVVSIFPPVGGG
jgi:sulfur-carrier protein